MPEERKTRSELKREAIVQAAKHAFKEYGIAATSMDKLADIAQVSKRTVYNHFASKEALVMHLLSDLWNTAMVDVEFHYDAKAPLAAQLTELLMHEINLVGDRDYIELTRIAMGHFLFQPEAVQDELAQFSSEQTALYKWLVAAKQDGRLNILDIERAYTQVHSLLKGSGFWPQVLQTSEMLSPKEKKALVDETVSMFMARYAVID